MKHWITGAALIFAACLWGSAEAAPVTVCGLPGTADQNKCVIPNANGSIDIEGSISSSTEGHATAADPSYVEGSDDPFSLDLSGHLRAVLPSSQIITTGTAGAASSQVVTIQGVASMTAVAVSDNGGALTVDNGGTFAVQAQPTPVTTGGLSVYFVQPTASDNHVVIKAGAGQVYKVTVMNNSATVNYLRLYNATTGFNGCNSATNLVYQIQIPASTTVGGVSDSWDLGMAFATGISICVTSGYATTDVTNATASAMSVNIGYK